MGVKFSSVKGQCLRAYASPYPANPWHNPAGRPFYTQHLLMTMMAVGRPIKTFPATRSEDTPPYLHDGRPPPVLLTLENNGEIF